MFQVGTGLGTVPFTLILAVRRTALVSPDRVFPGVKRLRWWQDYVNQNPWAFTEAYFTFNSLNIYE